jgi:hypothetical protein
MQLNRHSKSPDLQVDHFHEHEKTHRKVDVAFRYVHAEAFADQANVSPREPLRKDRAAD